MEIWRDIIGYEELYQVSSLGRIKSLSRQVYRNRSAKNHKGPSISNYFTKEKILKLIDNRRGYLTVNLCKNSIKTIFYVHRLVAQAFILNLENKPQVNHKDANRSNNNLENLEWVTQSENNLHGVKNFGNYIGESNSSSKLKVQDVVIIRNLYDGGNITQKTLAKQFNVTKQTINLIVHGKRWQKALEFVE